MTKGQIQGYIVAKWISGHAPQAIMAYLVCLGQPVTKKDVMLIIREYVDRSTENRSPQRFLR